MSPFRRTASTILRAAALLVVAALASCVDVELTQAMTILGSLLPQGDTDRFHYDGKSGTLVSLAVKADKNQPGFDFDVTLKNPTGQVIDLTQFAGYSKKPGEITLKDFPLPADGQYVLTLTTSNTATAGGDYKLTWKAGKGGSKKLDVRAWKLGRPSGGETAIAATIHAAAGGRLEDKSDSGAGPSGAYVQIPAGALKKDAYLALFSAATPKLADATKTIVSPAFVVSPAPKLSAPAEMRMAYDSTLVPRGVDPATQLVALRVQKNGAAVVLPVTSVDVNSRLVTFAADSLAGTFVVAAPSGLARLQGRFFWRVSLAAGLDPDPGMDSRVRRVVLRDGTVTFDEAGADPLQGADTYSFNQSTLLWSHDAAGAGDVTVSSDGNSSKAETWTATADGRELTTTNGVDTYGFSLADDASAAVGRFEGDEATTAARIDVALWRGSLTQVLPATLRQMAGTFTVGVLQIHADDATPGPVALRALRTLGSLTLKADGTWKGVFETRGVSWDAAGLRAAFVPKATTKPQGTWAASPDVVGAFELKLAGDPALFLRLLPAGDVGSFLAFRHPTAQDPTTVVAFGARAGKTISAKALNGSFAAQRFGVAILPIDGGPPAAVGDVAVVQDETLLAFDGKKAVTVTTPTQKAITRFPPSSNGVNVETGPVAAVHHAKFKAGKDGKLTLTPDGPSGAGSEEPPGAGAVAPGARWGFFIQPAPDVSLALRLGAFVRRP